MSLIEDPCGFCTFYVGKLRETTDVMRQDGDIYGFGKWEFYLGKMLEDSFQDDEAGSIEKILCAECSSLSIYGRGYIRELKERISEADKGTQTLDNKSKADIVRSCAPILDKITRGQKKLFCVAYKDMNSGKKTEFQID